jgi:uncharacterized low-complexity protein
MKKLMAAFVVVGFAMGATLPAHAEETMGEKAQSTGRDAKRAVKKGAHRVGEAMCMEGDVKCAAKKAKNRVNETGEAIGDKAKDVKESVD